MTDTPAPTQGELQPETLPDRLSTDPGSPWYNETVLSRDVGIRFKGVERTNVEEYCVSESWVRMSVGVAKGMKLKGIFGEVQDGAWAIVSRADSPIRKPEDLIGRSVATTADHKAMLDLLLAINKVPADKVTIQVTSPATRNTVFVNGQVDSFISVVIGSPLDLVVRAQQGKDKPVYFMPFADFGITPMGQGLLAHERVIAEKPEMLRRFVRASAKALNEVITAEKTEEAVDVAMRLSGAREERRESVKLQWLETTRRLATKNTEGQPLGWMSDKDWAVSVDILVKTGQLEKSIAPSALYTNEFVPAK